MAEDKFEEHNESVVESAVNDNLQDRLASANEGESRPANRTPLAAEAGTDKAKDALRRGGIVRALVGVIQRLGKTSAVVSLEGKWGDGKTTVLNFAREELREQCYFIDLEPWHWSQAGDMTERLANSLREQLLEEAVGDSKAALERRQSMSEALEAIANELAGKGFQSVTTTALRWAAILFLGAFGALGYVLRVLLSLASFEYKVIAGILLLVGAAGVYCAPMLVKWIARGLASKRKHAISDLIDQYEGEGRRIICVLDDVDRLTKEQILELCQILKATLNLPGLHFVLCIDRVAVQEILRSGSSDRVAEHYLEKIIQHRVPVPTPAPELVAIELDAELSAILAREPELVRPDQRRYEQVFTSIVMPHCRNLRDVIHLREMFQLMLDATRDPSGAVQIDIPDLLALSATIVFDPDAWSQIHERFQAERLMEVELLDLGGSSGKRKQDEFREGFSGDKKVGAWRGKLLDYLFPDQDGNLLFRQTDVGRNRRFQEPAAAHIYFALSGEELVSISLAGELLDPNAEPEDIVAKLEGSLSEDQRSEFASLVQGLVEKDGMVSTTTLVALVQFADRFENRETILERQTKRNLWSLSSRFYGAVSRYFSKALDIPLRLAQLNEVMGAKIHLGLRVDLLTTANRYEQGLEAALVPLFNKVCAEVESWLIDPDNIESPYFLDLFYRYRDYAGIEAHKRVFEMVDKLYRERLLVAFVAHLSDRKSHPWANSAFSYVEDFKKIIGQDFISGWASRNAEKIAGHRYGAFAQSILLGEHELGDGMFSDFEVRRWYESKNLPLPKDNEDAE